MTPAASTTAWPYPFWIAHRGAGQLAPENTQVAFEYGAHLGFAMFECDVQLSADGVPFLLHDLHLTRTTNGDGLAAGKPWSYLSGLDAGRWHGPAHAGQRLLRLDALSQWIIANGHALNIEIKPAPNQAQTCGAQVARAAQTLWVHSDIKPVLSSFSVDALQAAGLAAPNLPRALLMDAASPPPLTQAIELGCAAVVMHRSLCSARLIDQAHQAGLRAWAYTVNDPGQAMQLTQWGIDGLITDEVTRFSAAKRA